MKQIVDFFFKYSYICWITQLRQESVHFSFCTIFFFY